MDDALSQSLEAPAAERVAPPPTVLCVDDEPNILLSLRRVLRNCDCQVVTANGGLEALERMRQTPAAVVVSDRRMPGMDGVQFLERIREGWPEAVRILLTGHAEMGATVAAINRGGIFRYISKPLNEVELAAAVRQGLELVSLQRDKARLEQLTLAQNLELRSFNEGLERRILERTSELDQANKKLRQNFLTSIKVFSNLLELRGGRLLGHGRRVASLARAVAQLMALSEPEVQDIFVAGLLHDIGHIGLPDALLSSPVARLSPGQLTRYRQHPQLGEQSLMALEDMQSVAALIRSHHERYDGRGYPDGKAGPGIPIGSRILAVVDTFDELQNGHLGGAHPSAEEVRILLQQGRGSQFDPEVLEKFLELTQTEPQKAISNLILAPEELVPGMELASDLISLQGVVLLMAGQRLTESLIRRIRIYEHRESQQFRLQIHQAPDSP
jgi:response regulator RpfG family c-di-GMP phosphodiesterase